MSAKRKNNLNSQQFDLSSRNSKFYIELKEEYLSYLRKRNIYEAKLEKSEQARYSSINDGTEVEEQFSSIKLIYNEQKHQLEDRSDHNKVVYNTLKRKLELAISRNERSDDINKKRYYHMLKDIEKLIGSTNAL